MCGHMKAPRVSEKKERKKLVAKKCHFSDGFPVTDFGRSRVFDQGQKVSSERNKGVIDGRRNGDIFSKRKKMY